jgi:HK97 family phage major capsid protein
MSQSKRLQELRATRAQIGSDLRRLVDENPGDKWTADCTANYDNALQGIDKIDAEIGRIEKALKVADAVSASLDQRAGDASISDQRAQDQAESEMAVFRNWMRDGMQNLTPEQQVIARQRMAPVQGAGVGTGAAGGFTVPQEFLAMLDTAMRAYGGMREVATVITTASGADMPMPTNNDTGNSGSIIAENTAQSNLDVTFGQVILRAFMYTSGMVPVSYQLLQDTAFDMGEWLATTLGTRLARIENNHFTLGTGAAAQPQGIANASVGLTIGHTQPTGAGNVAGYNYTSLVTVEHSVDPAYRRSPSCRWMLSDTALRQVRLILDSQNRPLFVPGYTIGSDAVGGAPDTMMGYRIVINQDMPVPAANARSIAFGDFSKYFIREVQGTQVVRLNERFADALQVAFFGYQRVDGRIVDSGTNPIRLLQNSAS